MPYKDPYTRKMRSGQHRLVCDECGYVLWTTLPQLERGIPTCPNAECGSHGGPLTPSVDVKVWLGQVDARDVFDARELRKRGWDAMVRAPKGGDDGARRAAATRKVKRLAMAGPLPF